MTALRHGTTDSDLDRETWTTHDSVHYWRQWTEVTKDKGTGEEKKTRMTQAYTREADSVLLGRDGIPQPATRLRVPHGRPCRVQRRHLDEKCTAAWSGGGPKALRKARQETWSHKLVSEDIRTRPIDTGNLSIQAHGLLQPHPTLVKHLNVGDIRCMLAAPRPVLPRAWDPADVHDHYSTLYADRTPREYTAAVRRAFRGARHHTIPPHMQDMLYKILVSGHWIGAHKETGHARYCTACRQRGRRVEESVEHLFGLCEGAHDLWKWAITAWNAATTQELDHTDLRVLLLADRGVVADALTEDLWRMLHASVTWTLYAAAKRAREHQNHGNVPHAA